VVEHLLAKEKVAGSIPVSRSNLSGKKVTGRVVLFSKGYTTQMDYNILINAGCEKLPLM
jgi:hypothetical protein